MGRKKQNPESSAKRRHILHMASKMFTSQGYAEVSMDALAEAVPVSKRTLYNHFKDKKALFAAVMQGRCQLIYNSFEQTLKYNQSAEKTLTTIGQKFLHVVLEPDGVNIYRTAITIAHQFPELGKLLYESGPKRSTAILAEYLKKLDADGELSVPDPELAANIFLGMLTNRTQMKCMLGINKKISGKEKNRIIHYAVKMFINGQRPAVNR